MVNKKHSISSIRWLNEHFNDQYVKRVHKTKIRSRAWFKLDEIQRKNKIFKLGMNVVDLGSSPGSWSQYASQCVGEKGFVIACDILPMVPINNVCFLQGDFRKQSVINSLFFHLKNKRKKIDIVMSDMAPNVTGHSSIDVPNILNLGELALSISKKLLLLKKGIFLVKIFQGKGFEIFLNNVYTSFQKVVIFKPYSSRSRSREIFIIAFKRKT